MTIYGSPFCRAKSSNVLLPVLYFPVRPSFPLEMMYNFHALEAQARITIFSNSLQAIFFSFLRVDHFHILLWLCCTNKSSSGRLRSCFGFTHKKKMERLKKNKNWARTREAESKTKACKWRTCNNAISRQKPFSNDHNKNNIIDKNTKKRWKNI